MKLLLVPGVVLAVLAAALGHLASSGKRSAAAASRPPSLTVAVPAGLGKGRRTIAVKQWLKRQTNKGFLMMGLYFCGQFEAQQS